METLTFHLRNQNYLDRKKSRPGEHWRESLVKARLVCSNNESNTAALLTVHSDQGKTRYLGCREN